ncbi:MAG: glycosyltransferase family 2 protein [Lachnospiraceae bacterium]|nr:glycosyltransferase family 2 protein [Lachnospiraceae bacterium]
MTGKIKFSIVVPVFNKEKYLCELIESVLAQTYTNWEMILVDDGSTDSSGAICDSYVQDARVRVLHTKNNGMAMSRFLGLKEMAGDYVLVFDADDIISSNCLERLLKHLEESSVDAVIFSHDCFGEKSETVHFPLENGGVFSTNDLLFATIRFTNHGLWNKAIRCDVMRKAMHHMTLQRVSVNADYLQLIPIICEVKNAIVINEVLYHYRVYTESISHKVTFQHIVDTDYVTSEVYRQIDDHKLMSKPIESAIMISYMRMVFHRIFLLMREHSFSRNMAKQTYTLPFRKKATRLKFIIILPIREVFFAVLFKLHLWWLDSMIVRLFSRSILHS